MRRALLIGLLLFAAVIAAGVYFRDSLLIPAQRSAGPAGSAAPAGAASPARRPSSPAGQEQVVARMHAYLDREIGQAAAAREKYWRSLRAANGTVEWGRARRDLRRLLRIPDACAEDDPAAELERTVVARSGEGVIERITLEVCRGQLLAVGLVGWPNVKSAAPLVVAFHGTAATPEKVFGIDDPAEFDLKDYHHGFGRALMARGFAVFAPLLLTETRADPRTGYNGTRNLVNHRALPLGDGMNGMQLGMVMSAAGYLLRDERVRPDRLGAYGISHGGQLAFYFAALDRRVRATVVSQWIEARDEKLSGAAHPDALWREPGAAHNQYPDILRYFTDAETASLIAPRALFIEAGRGDGERAASAAREFPKLASAYRRHGAPPAAVCMELADAGHEIVMKAAGGFLEYWLHGSKGSAAASICPLPDSASRGRL